MNEGLRMDDRRAEGGGQINNENFDNGHRGVENNVHVENGHHEGGHVHDENDDHGEDNGDHEQPAPRRTLQQECERRPYLDGRFFRVDLANSSFEGYIIAECVTCPDGKTIKGSLATSSNFTTHLKRVHPDAYANYKVYKETKRLMLQNEDPQRRRRIQVTCSFSQADFETNVSNYILESMAPFSTVEMPCFRKIFDDLEIQRGNEPLKHLTRRTLCRRITDIHATNMGQLRTSINENAKFVCTTADIWTSRNRRFLGVTAHWVNEETLGRESAALACRRFPGIHSYANIARCLTDIHESFGLTVPKLCATVTDNGSNFVKAFREFGIDLPDLFFYETLPEIADSGDDEDSPDENQSAAALENRALLTAADDEFRAGLPLHLRCASHTLNLIATTDCVKIIENCGRLALPHAEAIGRCTSLWKALRSPRNSEIMREELGVALLRPVVTRWNSLYDAISQIVSLKVEISNLSTVLAIRNPLTDNDFAYLQEYLLCMRPIAEAIDRLQGETYCYYGYLLPTLFATRKRLMMLPGNEAIQICRPLLEGLITALERRFQSFYLIDESCQNAAIAAVSHPKFKTRWFSCLDAENQTKVRNLVLRAATEAAARQQQVQPMEEDDDYFDFGQPAGSQEAIAIFGHGEAEIEFVRYTNNLNTDLGMLRNFPIMRSLFVKYNAPLPSSAPVERLFSFATMMNLPRYNRLTDVHFEQRVLSKANAKRNYQ